MLDPSILYTYRATHLVTDECKKGVGTWAGSRWPNGSPAGELCNLTTVTRWVPDTSLQIKSVPLFPFGSFSSSVYPAIFSIPSPSHHMFRIYVHILLLIPLPCSSPRSFPKMFPTYFVSIPPPDSYETRVINSSETRKWERKEGSEISNHRNRRCRQTVRCCGPYDNLLHPPTASEISQRIMGPLEAAGFCFLRGKP